MKTLTPSFSFASTAACASSAHDCRAESRASSRFSEHSFHRQAAFFGPHNKDFPMSMLKDPSSKYRAFPTIDLPDRTWPSKTITPRRSGAAPTCVTATSR
jgi:hypothetical protein